MLTPQRLRTPRDGSRTLVQLDSQSRSPSPASASVSASDVERVEARGVLHLRGGPRSRQQHVAWTDDVVDNEKMGKKKSKICCIYHKSRPFDESSSSSSSSSSSDSEQDERPNRPMPDSKRAKPDARPHSDSDSDLDRDGAQPGGRLRSCSHRRRRNHDHDGPHDHAHDHPAPRECEAEDGARKGESSTIPSTTGVAAAAQSHGVIRAERSHRRRRVVADPEDANAYERQSKQKGKGKAKERGTGTDRAITERAT